MNAADINMIRKKLTIDPLKCTGCGACEQACALKHEHTDNVEKSRIRIIHSSDGSRFSLPSTCQHCENPPCLAVCPQEAIYRDLRSDGVIIDKNRCIGCKMCVSACPFGAMSFDKDRGRAFKCDLCEGEPECVRVCEERALDYVDDYMLNDVRLRESAGKYYSVIRHQATVPIRF
jgi:carbon-monoxide dehydrogenase iron sulfur subunit